MFTTLCQQHTKAMLHNDMEDAHEQQYMDKG